MCALVSNFSLTIFFTHLNDLCLCNTNAHRQDHSLSLYNWCGHRLRLTVLLCVLDLGLTVFICILLNIRLTRSIVECCHLRLCMRITLGNFRSVHNKAFLYLTLFIFNLKWYSFLLSHLILLRFGFNSFNINWFATFIRLFISNIKLFRIDLVLALLALEALLSHDIIILILLTWKALISLHIARAIMLN